MCLFSSYIQRPLKISDAPSKSPTIQKPPQRLQRSPIGIPRYPQVSPGIPRSRQAFLRNYKKSQKISKNLKFSKIKNIQNHYNRPKFKPTYYETKCSPEKKNNNNNSEYKNLYQDFILVFFGVFENFENFFMTKTSNGHNLVNFHPIYEIKKWFEALETKNNLKT